MLNFIDLHTHSTASDGSDTPFQLAEKAKSQGIQIFALTDHDTVSGVEQLSENLPEGISFVSGIEFSCRMRSGKCHILGYNCNTANQIFKDALNQGAALRRAKLEKRIEFLCDEGYSFPDEELEKIRQMPSAGKPHLGNLMVKYGYAKDRKTAINDIINRCRTESSRIFAEIAMNAILASGGIPVWAHPMGGEGEKETRLEQFTIMLDELLAYGLKGLECYYSKYPLALCDKLAKTANENNLLISGGSDYHGRNKSISLGTLNAEGQGTVREKITILDAL